MSTALRELLQGETLDAWLKAMHRALSNEKSRAFASASKLALEYLEGKPIDSKDRQMDKLLSRIEIIPGRPIAPLKGFEQLEKGEGGGEPPPSGEIAGGD